MKADRPGYAIPPEDGPHATAPRAAGRPWRALTLSLSVHAFIVAALFFFQWPGRVIEEPAPKIVRLVLGDGRSGAQGGGQSSRNGGAGTGEARSPASAAAGASSTATAAAPAEPPQPRPTGSSVGTPAEPLRPPTDTTDAAPDAAQPPAAATRADLREPPPLPTPRPYRPRPPPPAQQPPAEPPPPLPPAPSASQPAPADILPQAQSEPAAATPGPPIDLLAPRAASRSMGGSAGQGGAPGEGGAGRGVSGDGRAALGDGARENPGDDYLDRLRRHLARYKSYPQEAQDLKQEGTVVVTFTIGRDGTVSGAHIARSAGTAALDEAALDLLRTANPVPALPETFAGRNATVSLPITYSLSFLNRLF